MGIRERHPPQSKELHTMMPARDAQMKSPERKCYQGYGGILGNFLLFHQKRCVSSAQGSLLPARKCSMRCSSCVGNM